MPAHVVERSQGSCFVAGDEEALTDDIANHEVARCRDLLFPPDTEPQTMEDALPVEIEDRIGVVVARRESRPDGSRRRSGGLRFRPDFAAHALPCTTSRAAGQRFRRIGPVWSLMPERRFMTR